MLRPHPQRVWLHRPFTFSLTRGTWCVRSMMGREPRKGEDALHTVATHGSRRRNRVIKRLLNKTRLSKKKKLNKSTAGELKEKLKQAEISESANKEPTAEKLRCESRNKSRKRRRPTTRRGSKKKKIVPQPPEGQDNDGGVANLLTTPTEDVEEKMVEWVGLGVHRQILRALYELNFQRPTEIQKRTIPLVARDDNDVIGAAETGSGKTLAFGIPILQHILSKQNDIPGAPASSTEHAQKQVSTKGRKKKKESKTEVSNEGKTAKVGSKRDRDREENVIDLNEVLHRVEEGELSDSISEEKDSLQISDNKGATDESESEDHSDTGEADINESISLLSDEEFGERDSISSDDSREGGLEEAGEKRRDTGLIGVRDEIPDEDFERMIAGELDPWGSHDQAAMSHDNHSDANNTEDQSCDIKDVSCDSAARKEQGSERVNELVALILAPTRELAIQVHDHLVAVAKYTQIKVCAVVGGMAMEKQERLLNQRPAIVVATPGRLWSLMSEGNSHLNALQNLKFLVLDEADRMIEFGHFRELRKVLDRVNGAQGAISSQRRTMVFSATLTVDRRTTDRKRKKKTTSSRENLDNLMSYVNLKEDAHLVDLTRSKVTVETLTETKITCTVEEKDMYLYYFLLLYPGRTLVFVNSINCLQRLRALLEVLHMKPLPLHAHMQQRQRLKNLDRFTSSGCGVLVASDVAARGLDLPQVQHVIHYQVPRNTELYVHRSGRTARAQREGLSVMLVGPEDLKPYRNICKSLNKDEELPSFPVDSAYMKAIRHRVGLARQIHTLEHQRNKTVRSEQWLAKSAKALDIELDEDLVETHTKSSHRKRSSESEAKLEQLRADLKGLLSTPIIPRTISMTYPTRDHTHQAILTKIQATRENGTNKVVVSETQDALTVARTKAVL